MIRDWDVIRAILVAAEELPPNAELKNSDVPGYDHQVVASHMEMLHDAGYIKAIIVRSMNLTVILKKITYDGYDLLATMRSESVWSKIKKAAKSRGLELTLEAVKLLGKYALEETLKGE